MPGVQGIQIYPQPHQFPPGTFGTASPYQIGAYNQPPPNIPNQPNPRPQTPPTQGMPGAGGPAGHPAMNPMMPPYLSASQVQAASAAAASGHHSLPPNTHSQVIFLIFVQSVFLNCNFFFSTTKLDFSKLSEKVEMILWTPEKWFWKAKLCLIKAQLTVAKIRTEQKKLL